jgi:hypothetical protein
MIKNHPNAAEMMRNSIIVDLLLPVDDSMLYREHRHAELERHSTQ